MLKKKLLITCVFSLYCVLLSHAETVIGCHINGADYLFTNNAGRLEWVVNDYYKPKYPTYNQANRADFKNDWYNPNNCPRFAPSNGVNTGGENCAIQGITKVIVDPNNQGNNRLVGLGDTYSYELIYPTCAIPTNNLPIDDFLPFSIVLVGGIGFAYIRKGSVL